MKQQISLKDQKVNFRNILNSVPPKTTLINCSNECFEELKIQIATDSGIFGYVVHEGCIRINNGNNPINIFRSRAMSRDYIEATFTEDPKEVESLENPGLEDVRQLLNYAAKQLEKFQLTSAEISMTIKDIKYEIKVTK